MATAASIARHHSACLGREVDAILVEGNKIISSFLRVICTKMLLFIGIRVIVYKDSHSNNFHEKCWKRLILS